MPSKYWDEARARQEQKFRFDFPERTLAGKTIIVAGGTGGLGAATSIILAREGARLILGYRSNDSRARELQRQIQLEFPDVIAPVLIPGDLADPSVRARYFDAIAAAPAPAAFAGAAIFPGDPARVPLAELDRESMAASLEANFTAPLLFARDAGEILERGGGGGIVLVASMQAVAPFPGSVNYAAPKAALLHAARILAQQWKHTRVNVIAPGASTAGMAASSVQSGKYDRYVESGTIPRFGRAEDVARAVRFLLEPDNYINGQTLVVDGGLTARRS
jgi:NAD(P)-dependent dehydrogenase (short-subunit alcohol dehydrogenase family)